MLFTSSTDVYLSLNGEVIPNHGYVEISDIGSSDTTALLCHTNRPPPPGSATSGGDWFAPDGTRVGGEGSADVPGFGRNRGPMVVRLRRRTSGSAPVEGIYRCTISDASETYQTAYVGLYTTGGGMSIVIILKDYFTATKGVSLSGGIIFTLISDNQFTLACISTGGPATTVTWTRDSTTVSEGTETVLDDPVTAQYTHTLNVTTGGEYTCTVENNKPSSDSASITVPGIVVSPSPAR